MMSLKLQPCAFIQLEEASVAELQQQGGGGFAGGRVSDGEASALPLSRLDTSLVCSSCHSAQRQRVNTRDLLIPQQWLTERTVRWIVALGVDDTDLFIDVRDFVPCLNAVTGQNALQSKVPELWQLSEY